MRVGIYYNNPPPKAGGAYTLLNTIINDINSSEVEHDFYIFYNDSSAPKKYQENNIVYINCYKKNKKPNLILRIIRKFFNFSFKKSNDDYLNNIFNNENIDLLWILGPYYINTAIPFVFTVWDLGHRMLPCFPEVSRGNEWKYREKMYKEMLPKATYIIAGNKTGKNEIIANFPVNPEKIHIMPLPIPSFCFNDSIQIVNPSFQVNFPFIFYPAQFWAHKNHIILIETIAWLRDEKKIIINCYFTGYDHGNLEYVNKKIKKYNLENQIFIIGFISQDELIYLYKNALAMVFPSFLGPNNLPPLEAMALGCPLLYSDITGHIEQMEGAGLPINATNASNIGEAIIKIFQDSKFREDLILNGLKFTNKNKSYSYFNEMKKIINSFYKYYKTWKE